MHLHGYRYSPVNKINHLGDKICKTFQINFILTLNSLAVHLRSCLVYLTASFKGSFWTEVSNLVTSDEAKRAFNDFATVSRDVYIDKS